MHGAGALLRSEHDASGRGLVPQLATVLTEDDLRRTGSSVRMDLTPYLGLLETVRAQAGVGGVIQLLEGERQRAEKRRFSLAAKQLGYALTWRKATEPDTLRFVLAPQGEPMPDARKRRTPAAAPVATTRGRRRQ